MEQRIFGLSDKLKLLKDEKKCIEQEIQEVNAEIAIVESELIELMVEAELPSFQRQDRRFSLVVQNYPSPEPEYKDVLYAELKKRGYEHLFTINHQTLTSTLKEMISQNEDTLPDWLVGLVKNFEKSSIRVTKS